MNDRPAANAPYRAFGMRLIALMDDRREGRMNNTELAVTIGVTPAMPGRWRRGEGRPRLHTLRALADVLRADFDELAALCEYHFTDDRPRITGWDELTPGQQNFIRGSVAFFNEENEAVERGSDAPAGGESNDASNPGGGAP